MNSQNLTSILREQHLLDDTVDRLETMLEEARVIPGWAVALMVVGVLTLLAVCIPLTALIMMSPCLCCYRDRDGSRSLRTNEYAETELGVLGDDYEEPYPTQRSQPMPRTTTSRRHKHVHFNSSSTQTSSKPPIPPMDEEEDEMAL